MLVYDILCRGGEVCTKLIMTMIITTIYTAEIEIFLPSTQTHSSHAKLMFCFLNAPKNKPMKG